MGRAILIILLTSIVIFGVISIQVNRSSSEAGTSSSNYYRNLYTRNIANSMIEILRTKLISDTTLRIKEFSKDSILNGLVKYKLIDTLINGKNFVKGFVIANYEGVTHTSEAYFVIENLSNQSIPGFLKYAVFSGEKLQFNGGINITNAGNGLNANVHVNGNFSMNGNNKIDGFLTYSGMAWSNPPQALINNINPLTNPLNLPVHYKTQDIEIPEFEPEDIKPKATEIYYGNKTFNGTISLGTQQNPKIIYVSGNLTINGNVTGYGIFISKGKTTINGNVSIVSPALNVSPVGIYSGDELIINGNVTLNAQIFANEEVKINGNCKIYGNLVSRDEVLMNGNVTVYYRPPNEVLTKPVFSVGNNDNVVQVKTIYFYE